MKKGKQIWIPLVIIVLIVLNLFTAYQYSTLAQKLDGMHTPDFGGKDLRHLRPIQQAHGVRYL